MEIYCNLRKNDTDERTINMFKTMKERRSFIDNYRKWKIAHALPELALTIYKAELNTGAIIYAMEYMYMEYQGNFKHNVIYDLVMPAGDIFPNSSCYMFFKPSGCGITTLMEYLKIHPEAEVACDA